MNEKLRTELEDRIPDDVIPPLDLSEIVDRGRRMVWRRRISLWSAGATVVAIATIIGASIISDDSPRRDPVRTAGSTPTSPMRAAALDCGGGDGVSISNYAAHFSASTPEEALVMALEGMGANVDTSEVTRAQRTDEGWTLVVYTEGEVAAVGDASSNEAGRWGLPNGFEVCAALLNK